MYVEGPALRSRTVRMASRKATHLRSLCRIRHPSNQQKVTLGAESELRDVKYEDRSDYVHENKGMHDKLSGQNAGILRILG